MCLWVAATAIGIKVKDGGKSSLGAVAWGEEAAMGGDVGFLLGVRGEGSG